MSIERVQIGEHVLYCGESEEIVPILNSIDAIITDPPFGIKFKYESHNDTPDGYGAWLWAIIKEAESKCTPGSPVFVWQAMLNVKHFAEWFPRDWRIFAAAKNFVQMRPTPMQYSFDPVIVWWTKGKPWAAGTSSRDFHIGNTAHTMNRGASEAAGHPCARPLDQVRHIIEQWVRPEGVCLDCFMGSGTTGVACSQTGRKFIGIEKEPAYFDLACRRIEAAEGKGSLFEEHKPEQLLFAEA